MTTENFTVKEMLTKVLEQNEQFLVKQTTILNHAENVDRHLEVLNSKVATNVDKIQNLEKETGKVKTVFATLSILLSGAWAVVTFVLK